jgi:pimeloyl-ACP methyl ester carboxylesterase
VSHYIRTSIRGAWLILCLIPAAAHAGSARPVAATNALATPPVIVIGFVGGFVRHDATAHSAVQVAAHLREDYPSGVYAEVLENHRRKKAHAEIVRFVDTDRDGTLSVEEKHHARIILYGHSWGASEAVTLARELEREGIPVLLTVLVDSVSKPGQNDKVIPANVAQAANFYQRSGFLHGQSQIRAADPTRTHILGNFRFDYKSNPIHCKQYPWYDRLFMRSHIEIECDPRVWTQVESLIGSKLPLQQRGEY